MRPTLHGVPRALRALPPWLSSESSFPTLTRQIRIKTSDDPDPRPPEDHVLDRKGQREGSLDPQAQNAKSSMGAPLNERPAYVHSRVNKSNVAGGASAQGKEEAAAQSLWERLKQLLGIHGSSKETRYGSGSQDGKN